MSNSKNPKQRVNWGVHRAGRLHVEQMLLVGASRWEATQAVVQRSLTAALGPTLSHMGAAGIVTLPSFMSGQLLGGVPPIQVPPPLLCM